ncbi:MAG: hypothetical protein N3A01_01740 [Bacteroidales bacterium]|nr:hypothetical protein [Bacteroidales bacterium]
MKLLKVIASITTPAKGERILMSIIVGIFIFELYLFYSKLYPFNVLFKRYILIILLLIIFTTISKFSYHSYSAGAMLSLLLLYYFSSFSKYLYNTNMAVLLSLFLISGLILTSRLVTKAHSFSQVIRGFIMGVISSFITFVIF